MESKEALSKYNQPFPTRLRELLNRKRGGQRELAKRLEKTSQAIGYYKDGSTVPDVNVLAKIADFYSVSTDYLLGRTDVSTPDIDTQGAAARYGLWEESLSVVENLDEEDRAALNTLLCSPQLPDILTAISKCFHAYTESKVLKLMGKIERIDQALDEITPILSKLDDPKDKGTIALIAENARIYLNLVSSSGDDKAASAINQLQRAAARLGEDLAKQSREYADALTEDDVKGGAAQWLQ